MTIRPEHIGLVVPHLETAMDDFARLGHTWSSITHPEARIRRAGRTEVTTVRYVVTSGGLPRVKLIEEVLGTYWVRSAATPLHHLTYWTEDLDAETERLLAAGATVEADGLEDDGSVRYRYLLLSSGARIELSRSALRDEFEEWASS